MTAASSIVFEPIIPALWLGLIALGMSAIVAASVLRGQKSALYRLGFIAVLLIALANPQRIETQNSDQRGIAVMVLDDSDSQSVTGRLVDVQAAQQRLENTLKGLPGVDWKVARLSDHQANNTSGTMLVSAMSSVLQDVPVKKRAGIVLITDGQIDDIERLKALNLEAPVHAVITGKRDFKDRRLVIAREPAFAEVGVPQSVKLTVEDIGYDMAQGARLEWQLNEMPVQSRLVTPGEEVSILYTPQHRGQNILDISVETRDGEVSTINNRVSFAINGVRNRLRVVLVSGEPYQGERLWRSTLKSDPSVDLVHFTILRLPTSRDVTPVGELSLIPFPTQELFEKNLDKFDLVIFDRYSMRGVLQARYLANLADYVRGGGALLVAVGPEYGDQLSLYTTPLGNVLPVAPRGEILDTAFVPEVTNLGQRHPVTAGLIGAGIDTNKDWGPWYRLSAGNAVTGQTVMKGPMDLPLLVLDRRGEGRVAMVMSDQSWVWARGISGGGPYAQFVRRLVHWLMREPDLEEEHLAAAADGAGLTITRRSLQDSAAPVTVLKPDGTRQSLTLKQSGPGVWTGRIPTAQQGLYRVSDDAGIALVAIGADNRAEVSSLRPTSTLIGDTISGGLHWQEDGPVDLRLIDPDDRASGNSWFGLHDKRRGEVISVTQNSLLPAWLWLLLLSGSLLFAWWRESR